MSQEKRIRNGKTDYHWPLNWKNDYRLPRNLLVGRDPPPAGGEREFLRPSGQGQAPTLRRKGARKGRPYKQTGGDKPRPTAAIRRGGPCVYVLTT